MSKKTIAPRKRALWHWLLISPYLAGINVIFAVVIGIVATMFHEELTNSTPLTWLQDTSATDLQWTGAAIIFWSALLLFAAVLTGRAWCNASDRQDEVRRLETILDESPPEDFLKSFADLFPMLFALANTHDKNVERMQQLRLGLEMVIQLAKRWDQPTSTIMDHYRSNVMLRIEMKDWSEKHIKASQEFYLESEWNGVKQHADCGLWVNSELATEEKVNGLPDNDVDDLMLLVSEKKDGHKTINIEGAPRALTSRIRQYVPDTATIAASAPNSINKNIKTHIKDFYEKDEKARSIISLPLVWNDQAIGVINVYRNSEGFMGSDDRAESFGRIMSPFTTPIAQIVNSIRITG